MAKNYYLMLGISSDATMGEIKSAFRQRALELHPDRSGLESERFMEVQEAYGVLSDAERRHRYDRQATQQPRRPPWGTAAEPLRSPRPAAEPLRPVAPASGFRDVRLDTAFNSYRPSFDELFDRWWSNFETLSRPKAEQLESLTVEVVLSADEARRGGTVQIEIPALATCPACGGRGALAGYECWRCEGQGRLMVHYPVPASYPPGIRDRSVTRLSLTPYGIDNFFLTLQWRVSEQEWS